MFVIKKYVNELSVQLILLLIIYTGQGDLCLKHVLYTTKAY